MASIRQRFTYSCMNSQCTMEQFHILTGTSSNIAYMSGSLVIIQFTLPGHKTSLILPTWCMLVIYGALRSPAAFLSHNGDYVLTLAEIVNHNSSLAWNMWWTFRWRVHIQHPQSNVWAGASTSWNNSSNSISNPRYLMAKTERFFQIFF